MYPFSNTPPRLRCSLLAAGILISLMGYAQNRDISQLSSGGKLNPLQANMDIRHYTISLDVRSKGVIIAQFKTTKILTLDQKVTLVNYIPLKMDEFDIFDGVGVTYTRLPE